MKKKKKRLTTLGYIVLGLLICILVEGGYLVYSYLFAYNNAAIDEQGPVKVTTDSNRVKIANQKKAANMANEPITEDPSKESYSILIKKSEFMLYVKKDDQIVESFKCALGKNKGDKTKRGDMKTPNGTFVVDEICDAHTWSHDFNDGKGVIEHAYGPWFLSLDTKEKSKGQWDGIGIHGTHAPESLGTLASEGCIRIHNDNIEKLKRLYVKCGTKVTIEE